MRVHNPFGRLPRVRGGALSLLACLSLAALTADAAGDCPNLLSDPGFEQGVSGFEAQDASSAVTQSSVAPLEGAHSLRVAINGYGNNVWWSYPFAGGLARHLTVGAHLRSDTASTSDLQFCAMAYYADGSSVDHCTTVRGSAGDKGVVSAAVDLDPVKPLASVNIRLSQLGGAPVRFSFDGVTTCLDVISGPTDGGDGGGGSGGGGGDNGGGGSGGGTGGGCTPPTGSSVYPGFTYHLPTARPFLSLEDYAHVDTHSTAYTRFRDMVNRAVSGNPDYGYSAVHSVIMYRLTGQAQYIQDAINRVEAQVHDAEVAIAAGNTPAISSDSYLDVGWYIEQLSLTYDYGFERLTQAQRQRWEALAEQAIYNVWHPDLASWGGVTHTWSGWSICDPGNNYHYSFLKATMLWALTSQNTEWISFLQTQKFPPLLDYFAALPGGGTREGTGYGTAIGSLLQNYLYWKASTGEDLAGITAHPRETIDYWVNATVPTLDRFAPIGDLSRESIPNIYDYHRNLVHQAVVLSAASDQAKRGTWWLQNNSLKNGVTGSFNLLGDLLPYPATAQQPTELVYHSTGAGALFARSSWATNASWFAFIAGKYDQSHAHHDQGSFTFFKNDWLAVTSNIWSHSGIHQEDEVHNTLRFVRGDGSTIQQNPSDSVQSSLTYTSGGGVVTVAADLANAYSNNRNAILSWTRNLEFSGSVLRVHDVCSVATGVRPIFQLQVPALPVLQPDGSLLAGHLRIAPLQPVTASWTAMPSPEFSKGYRIDLTTTSGCGFNIELRAQ
jgi:hypothetical protein